jgi:hypothetical protein
MEGPSHCELGPRAYGRWIELERRSVCTEWNFDPPGLPVQGRFGLGMERVAQRRIKPLQPSREPRIVTSSWPHARSARNAVPAESAWSGIPDAWSECR